MLRLLALIGITLSSVTCSSKQIPLVQAQVVVSGARAEGWFVQEHNVGCLFYRVIHDSLVCVLWHPNGFSQALCVATKDQALQNGQCWCR